MKDYSEEFKENMAQFSCNCATGKIRIKLLIGNIIWLNKTEKIAPKEKVKNETITSTELFSRFINKLRAKKSFCDLAVNFVNGQISKVEVYKIYKSSDMEEYLIE